MQSLRHLINRVRAWRMWQRLRVRSAGAGPAGLPSYFVASRPIYRDVSSRGVRVYSLCGSCGAHLAASATLCDACARSRSTPNS